MPSNKKRFTEDFVAKWSKTSDGDGDGTSDDLLRRQQKLLKRDPKNARLWFAYGETLLSLGRAKEALSSFAKAEKLDATLPRISLALASVHSLLGNVKEASERYLKALRSECERIEHPYLFTLTTEYKVDQIVDKITGPSLPQPADQRRIKAISLLQSVPGIGELKAKALFDSGFRSVDDLR